MPASGNELSHSIDDLSLADLEAIRLLLRGGSVIDWHRLNFSDDTEVEAFVLALELDLLEPVDRARIEAVKNAAIAYLKRSFDFPVPKPVAALDLAGLLKLASASGHRQLCACTILKVMHIIHHLEARELLFMLPTSDEEISHLVEEKLYRAIGGALAQGFPIVEFIGGRKNRDSVYSKLLSKPEVNAAQIYDKLRFRIVTRGMDDIFPMLRYLMRTIFPFNFIVPGESTNTLIPFSPYCDSQPHLRELFGRLQFSAELEGASRGGVDNEFSASSYRVVHFVADMPIRISEEMLQQGPPSAWALGRIIFVQVELQLIDQETDRTNELGDASHAAYKERQRVAVMRRLKVGREDARRTPKPPIRPKMPPPNDEQ